MLISELFAEVLSMKCTGSDLCHWCGAPCGRGTTHDDKKPLPGTKYHTTAKVPSSAWICNGCAAFRRPKNTIHWVDGNFKDSQSYNKKNFLIKNKELLFFTKEHSEFLYPILLNPPHKFALNIIEEGDTKFHLIPVNENKKILSSTPIHFLFNGVAFEYTVYELEMGLRADNTNGLSSGTAVLINYFGHYEGLPSVDKPAPGRPKLKDPGSELKRVVVKEQDEKEQKAKK